MRDPARIERILSKIGKFWSVYPDLRFCQLVYYFYNQATGISTSDFFNLEDDLFEEAADSVLSSLEDRLNSDDGKSFPAE